MKHILEAQKKISEMESKYFHKGIAQITIDLIESADDLFRGDESVDDERFTQKWPTTDDLGSLSYRCHILLEVINPELKLDVEAVNEVDKCVEDALNETKRVNELLRTRDLLQSGYAGVNQKGEIVDIRQHPEAVPMPQNKMMGIPATNAE